MLNTTRALLNLLVFYVFKILNIILQCSHISDITRYTDYTNIHKRSKLLCFHIIASYLKKKKCVGNCINQKTGFSKIVNSLKKRNEINSIMYYIFYTR